MDFSIVIPCFNESSNIPNLLNEIKYELSEFNYEIIIVDDYSSDNSVEVIKKFDNNIVIIENYSNQGQSFSISEGVKCSKSNTIITLDCDGQNNPKDIKKLFSIYKNNSDIKLVGGLRLRRIDSYVKIFSSKVANAIRKFFLKDDCIDSGCGLKVFDKEIFLRLPFFNGIHRFLPALYKGKNCSTHFTSVDHRARKFGNSKYGTMKRAFNGIIDLIKVYYIIKSFKNE